MRKQLRDFFIPHEGNDFAPHSLQKMAITGMAALVMLSFTFANVQSILWITSDWMISTVLPAVVVDLTNNERSGAALSSLQRNTTLDEAARLKAQHMAENEYFAHHSPDGVSPWYWFAVTDYSFVHAGENLAIHFTDSGEVVDAWMDSPTHRANIMNGSYTEIGVGTAEGTYDGFNTVYVVQLFGTPAAQPTVAGTETPNVSEAPEVIESSGPEEVDTETTATLALVERETNLSADTTESEAIAENNTQETGVLAEEVAVSESVEMVPAEPVAQPATSAIPNTFEASEMEVTDNGVALFSDHVSSSTGAVPATTIPDTPEMANEAPFFYELLTQPHLVLQMLYVSIGMFVFAALMLSVVIELKRQRPLQIAYSFALLLLMSGLFYVHSILTAGAVVV